MTDAGAKPDLPELFARAEELSGDERARFLSELEAHSPATAAELVDLLAVAEQKAPWLSAPAWRPRTPPAAGDLPSAIGPYRVLSELGRGGAGRVFLTEEEGQGFVRRVAVKVLSGALTGGEAVERFRIEGRLLAGLEHPGIARLYDTGTTPDGVPYLAMEYVDGIDLVGFVRARGLGTRQRVEVFLQVLEAVQFAHRQLIVHRDLKPANLLVDSTGRVKLLDFGIAKLLDEAENPADASLTRTGQRWLTPAYASPEQIRGERTTTAADIYSLGVVLYELLAGRRPHEATGPELEAAVLGSEPAPPSRWTSPAAPAAAKPASALSTPARELKGDLDAIALYALRKEPAARYRSVEAFAADLRRHLDGFPVLARQGTRRYRWGKFVRRNRRSLAAGVAIFAALAVGLGTALWQARRAAVAQAHAERRFTEVQGLATSMIFEISNAIEPLDGSGPAMELTVDRALEYLGRLEADAGDDPQFLTSLAAGYQRVGEIAGTLPIFGRGTGHWEKGIAAFERALELRRRLVELPGSGPEQRVLLARSWVHYCGALRAGRDPQRAAETCHEAVRVLSALVELYPERPDYRLDLATALTQKLFVQATLVGADQVARSPELDRLAILWEQVTADPSAPGRSGPNYPWGLSNTSHWLRIAGRSAEALTLNQRAVAAAEEFAADTTTSRRRSDDLSLSLEALGNTQWDLGRLAEALTALERSSAVLRSSGRKDSRQRSLIRRFNLIGMIVRVSGEAGEIDRGERALAEGAQLLVEAAEHWKPDTVTWSRGLLERDRGRLYRAARERPGLSATSRRNYSTRARTAYRRAIEIFETLRSGDQDPFGVGESVVECREVLAELGGG